MIMPAQERLKILHFVYDHPENPWCGGGGARRTWAINNILAERHDITILCGSFPGAVPQHISFKVRFLGRAKRYTESRLKFIWESRKMNLRQYDLIVEEFSYYAPIISRFPKQPAVTILHGHHGFKALRYRHIYGIVSLISEKLLLPFRRSIIIVSEHLRPVVHSAARIAVIGQGADIPKNLPPTCENYVLFLGRLDVWHKGIDILIKAWARLPSSECSLPLQIVGGGDVRKVQALIESEGAKNVNLIGRLDHTSALSAIKRAAFICMPSRMEGSPLVLYEAFAIGKPVIGSSIPPIKALISHGIAGLLVPPEDPESLSMAIKSLMVDSGLRSRLARGAAEIGRAFNWNKVAEKQEQFYYETVGFYKR
jgi:glycosyltransferase involved in cell wall biosynthesis